VEYYVAVVFLEHSVLVIGHDRVGIVDTPLNIGFDVDSVSGSLGDGQSEIESDEGGDTSNTDDRSPCLVDSSEMIEGFADDLGLEGSDGNDRDNGGRDWKSEQHCFSQPAGELTITPSLGRKDSGHHSASDLSGSEFRGDD